MSLAFLIVAATLMAVAAWLVTPAWREDRVGRVAGPDEAAPHARFLWESVRERAARIRGGRRRRTRERVRVIQALSALSAELQSGQPPLLALVSAAGVPAVWPVTAGAAEHGQDVVPALHRDAERHEVLRHLAACWQVAAQSGSGLSSAVASLADSSRAAEEVRVQLEAELAGPRATARTLALLPLVGLGFGILMGGDPLGWLLTTGPGLACLAAGATLTLLGAWWTGRIAARVESML
jgi:tight adherence protein B